MRPEIALPQAWPATTHPAAGAVPLSTETAQAVSPWWKIYADPALDQLVEEAYAHNADIALAAARVMEAEAQLGLARADQVPAVYAEAGRSRARASEKTDQFQVGRPAVTTTNRATLVASFELDFWGKFRRSSEAARAALLATQAAQDAVRVSLTAQVVQGYYNLRAQDAALEAVKRSVARSREGMALQQMRFRAGVISEFELRQREAELEAQTAQQSLLERAQSTAAGALAVLLGRSPREILIPPLPQGGRGLGRGWEAATDQLAAPLPSPFGLSLSKPALRQAQGERESGEPGPDALAENKIAMQISLPVSLPAGLPSDLLLARPDLREAEQNLIAANARIGAARAAYFPSISLTGSLGSESASLADLFGGPARTWRFAGDMTQALLGGDRLIHQTEVAEARYQQALARYRQTIANAFREVQDAIVAQAKLRDAFEAETRRVAAQGKSFALAKLRYQHGVAGLLEVIDSERGLLAAEQSRIEAERGLKNAIADFYRAVGVGAARMKDEG